MFDNQDVGGSSGVWYTQWEHWVMEFAVRLEPCPSCTLLTVLQNVTLELVGQMASVSVPADTVEHSVKYVSIIDPSYYW